MIDVEQATVAGQVRPGDNIVHSGREAWMRIQSGATWLDWLEVGEALEFGRRQVEAEIEKAGRGNRDHAFSEWLKTHGFDKIDKATRSHLATCMANQDAIEEFRQNIGATKALRLNHPSTVLRAWKRATQPPTPRKPKVEAPDGALAPTDGQAIIEAQKQRDDAVFEAERLRKQVELYQNGFAPKWEESSAREIAKQLVDALPEDKWRKVADFLSGRYDIEEEPAPVEGNNNDAASKHMAESDTLHNAEIRKKNRTRAADCLKAHDKFLKPHERKRLTTIERSNRPKNGLGMDDDRKWLDHIERTMRQRAHDAERKPTEAAKRAKRKKAAPVAADPVDGAAE
ncbi:hypothetical protein [Methylocystis echinoides]|uniref:hypothetical protein n=1 Tax=Methylocystis echinoides TaxID=29468 RepID=UPI003424B469